MQIVIFIAIIGVVLGVNFWVKKRQINAWQSVASKLGLNFMNSGLFGETAITGSVDGINVNVSIEVVGHGKNKRVYTLVGAPLRHVPSDMVVYGEGFLQKMGKMFGGEDVQVGDSEIDATFIIKGRAADRIADLLTQPSVKRALIVGHKRCSSLRIEAARARIRERGRSGNADQLEQRIRTVIDTARAINEASSAPKPAPAPEAIAVDIDAPFGRPDDPTEAAPAHPAAADNDWW